MLKALTTRKMLLQIKEYFSQIFGIFPLFVFISALVNAYLKEFFHDPRPDSVLNIDPWLDTLDPSFGFPSGHAQLAIVIWGFLMLRSKNTWIRSIFIFLIYFPPQK